MTMYTPDLLRDWRVVVVEDEDDSLEVARYILEYHGATVVTANNGADGYALILDSRPDFAISDLSMPDMDGWGMIKQLRDNIVTRDIPVIALTAHAMVGDRERAISAGFYNYLTKPLTASTFMDQLVRLLFGIPTLSEKLNL